MTVEQTASLTGLRVVVANWRDPWHPEAGGAETYAWEMALGLRRRGAAVTYLTARADGSVGGRRPRRDPDRPDRVPVHCVSAGAGLAAGAAARIRRRSGLRERHPVLHAAGDAAPGPHLLRAAPCARQPVRRAFLARDGGGGPRAGGQGRPAGLPTALVHHRIPVDGGRDGGAARLARSGAHHPVWPRPGGGNRIDGRADSG